MPYTKVVSALRGLKRPSDHCFCVDKKGINILSQSADNKCGEILGTLPLLGKNDSSGAAIVMN